MGGGGHMLSANKSLKENRALLKKRRGKRFKEELRESKRGIELEFKQVAETELQLIKERIREKAERDHRSSMRLLGIVAFILIAIAAWITLLSYGMERLNF